MIRSVWQYWRNNRLFGLVVLVLLSAGVGVNTLVFSFVNEIILKPLPVRHPEDLVLLEKNREKQPRPDPSFFYAQYEQVAREHTPFRAVIAEQQWNELSFQRFTANSSVRLVTTQLVSPNYFTELGVPAILGRVLTRYDALSNSGGIPAVLSFQFWRSQFNGSRDVIGKTIRVNDRPFIVAGVLPESFHSLDVERAPDIRLPMTAYRALFGSDVDMPTGEQRPVTFIIVARLRPGISQGQAAAAAQAIVQPMESLLWLRVWRMGKENEPSSEQLAFEQNYRIGIRSASHGMSRLREQFSNAVLLLMGGVMLLMLGICANLAGLLSTRAQARRGELALRLAIGASRLQLLRQLLAEQLALALPSALLAVALSYLTAPWIVRLVPEPRGLVQYAATPQILRLQPDAQVLAFSLTITVLSILLFGLLPLWRASKLDFVHALKVYDRHISTPRIGLVTIGSGVALAVALASGSIAMLRTFWTLEHLDPGFDRSHVVEFTIDPGIAGYSTEQSAALRRTFRQRVASLPGVRATAWAGMGLMRGLGRKTTVVPQGETLPERTFLNTTTNTVSAEYFATLGIPLLDGHNLRTSNPKEIVVNRAFVDFFFPHATNVIGKGIVQGVAGNKPPSAIICGVVGTAKFRSLREMDPPIYYDVSTGESDTDYLYVRTAAHPELIINSVRRILKRLAPGVPLIEAYTLEEEVQSSLWQERIVTVLSGVFGAFALLLAAIGLYANIASSVASRSRELGIRMAVGAEARDIAVTLSNRLRWPVLGGTVLGLLASFALLRAAGVLLFGTDPSDPGSSLAATGLLMLVCAGACVNPILKAIRLDAATILREQ